MPKLYKKFKAFSLIEILIVVALMIILATITIIAINPGKNFQDTRNAQRSSDVSAILNAVTQYTSEQGNSMVSLEGLAGTINACEDAEGNPQAGSPIGTATVDLSAALVEEYIVEIPMDPQVGTPENTGYTICKTSTGRVQIDAPNAEPVGEKTISVKR
jgi:type IV pilus assembly protein PilA